jgi:PrtD family type I secretion system ABC transporter
MSIANVQMADQAIRNADAFRAMAMLPGFLARWTDRNERSLALQLSAADRNATLVGFSKFVRIFVQMLILGAGAYLVVNGRLTSGGMIAASILLGRALAPVEQAIGAWKNIVSARDAYDRLTRLLDCSPPERRVMPLPAPKGRLTCEQVIYVPRGRDKPVLNGVSFTLEPGEALGIVGPSAAGKSTLCKILVGSWQPTRGHARLDGADLFTWPSEQLGTHVGYLPQDVELLGGTVKDNIARLVPDADADAVVQAAMTAGVHEIILRLPHGYETEIGVGGSFLSGGQRQRLGLARALYRKPRLVVLDEPNASLDTDGEERLIKAIAEAKRWGATVILVAHQPRILEPVDKLLLLRDGRSEMFGPRDEVLAKLIPVRRAAKVRARVLEPAPEPAIGVPATKGARV